MNRKYITIVSGGQSGVDRAALDFALDNKIECGGWCPAGRLAEDGIIPDKYPLRETESRDVSVRTHKNINDSDGTLVLYLNVIDEGTRLTLEIAKDLKKPIYILHRNEAVNPSEFKLWLEINRIKTLNIAGPRESNEPGVYDFTGKMLMQIFK
jgi:hypothetical protein